MGEVRGKSGDRKSILADSDSNTASRGSRHQFVELHWSETNCLLEDIKLKRELREKLKSAGVSAVEIERPGNKLRIIIKTARPGIIIGRKGAEIDKLKQDVQKRTQSRCLHRHPGSA